MAVKLQIILTADNVEQMAQIAGAINEYVEALYKVAPDMVVDIKPSIMNQDKSVTESITILMPDKSGA